MRACTRVPARVGVFACLLAAPCLAAEADAFNGALDEARRLVAQGRYPEAGAKLKEALRMAEEGGGGVRKAVALNNLGAFQGDLENCEEGRHAYQRALAIWETAAMNAMALRTGVNLGTLLLDCGDTGAAGRLWRKTVEPRLGEPDANQQDRALPMAFQASLLYSRQKFSAAEPVARRALEIWRQTAPGDDVHAIMILNTLSLVHGRLRRYDEAVREQQEGLALIDRVYGPGHPVSAKLTGNLAALLLAAGRHSEAEEASRKAVEIAAASLGREHLLTGQLMLKHAAILDVSKRKAEARAEARDARAILDRTARGRQTVDVSDLAAR